MTNRDHNIQAQVAKYMRRLYERHLTSCSSGNVSARLSGDLVAITPSQTDKGFVKIEDIGVVNMNGEQVSGPKKLSMETDMHLAVYLARPDVKAIVHAHPVFATSFAVSQVAIDVQLTGESFAVLGTPILAPYALMGSTDLAENVAQASRQGNAILLENHGVLTVGDSLYQAYDRMEIIEFAAKLQLVTQALGPAKHLTESQRAAITHLINSGA